MTTTALGRGREFLLREGRVLERRIFATVFDGAFPSGAMAALLAYRNDDGGFGHGLEPDKRSPRSQPLDVETAFGIMDTLDRVDTRTVEAACDFLSTLGPGVGCLAAGALDAPAAPHWAEWATAPSLNPTAGLVARLWSWGIDHPWRREATAFCWERIEGKGDGDGLPDDAHGLGEVLAFLEAVDDRKRAEAVAAGVPERLPTLGMFHLDLADEGYGLTPLHLAPSPEGRWADLFEPAVLQGHLDALEEEQADDGGWTIPWDTVGPAAVQEWRGIETLRALRVLRAYGRLS